MHSAAGDIAAVRVAREFSAPPEQVFDAWLEPETAKQFLFTTPTGTMVGAEVDVRVGGRFTFTDRRDGVDIDHTGEYLEIVRPRRPVFTFLVPKYSKQATRVTIKIVPKGKGCVLTLTHEGVLPEYESRMQEGWNKILDAVPL